MVERERIDAHAIHAKLVTFLNEQQESLVERVARTAIERGYARYVPELHETLTRLVAGITGAIGAFVASETKSAFCPGEDFDNDSLAAFVRGQSQSLLLRGVRAEVVFGLLQQCRVAYSAHCLELALEHQEVWEPLLEVCFDRMEVGLISAWSGTIFAESGQWLVTEPKPSGDVALEDAERQLDKRINELTSINVGLRRELDRRLRVEEERERYYRALLHSQKLEAVGSLAGGVAHDLSNLLQVIRFNVDSLRERADRDSYGRLEEIGQVTERAVGLVRQLLLFSRKQPMARRVLDLGDVVRDLVRLLRRVIPENVRTHVEIDEHLPPVRADVSAIEQLLMNLMLNARDAMPNGGSIHVSVSRTRRVPPERIRIKSSMEQVALLVRDAGPGMAEDVLGRIFDPFFTTKVHSSGLGLSVVHGVAEEHGGWVEVSSVVGQGSCFAVYLPVAEEPSSAQDEESLGQTVCAGRGERLMLVEDDDVVRRALARELSRYGYTVQAVACGEEALKIYRRAPGYFDCVISDGLMPGVSGPEMVLDMLKVNPAQRAIFMSGYAPTLECWKDLQSRGYRLLAKPFGVSELVAAIRQTLDGDDDVQAPTVRASHLGR
ncbi:MAG: ATP-binding protein [Myxococcales bacterium]